MEILGIEEIKKLTGLSDKYIRHLVASEELKALPRKKGQKIRVPKINLERWLYKSTQKCQ